MSEEIIYRSRYNIFFELDRQKYIFNTWKGNLSLLDDKFYKALSNMDFKELTGDDLDELLKLGYLTKQKDEFNEVLMENISTYDTNKFSICILPTFRCNAKCEYCFEKGVLEKDITEDTIERVIKYIQENSRDRNVNITWFGGEPLVATDSISRICKMLRERGIAFSSSIISNGYLLDENIVKIKRDWNLRRIQITLDGLYEKYNDIKKIAPDAFDRVIKNISLAVKEKIKVTIRVNFDAQSCIDYKEIIKFIYKKFGNSVNLYFHDIVGEDFLTPNEVKPNPLIEMYEVLIDYGYVKNIKDMKVKRTYRACALNVDDYIIVCPDGSLTKCEHYVGKESRFSIGNINDEVINTNKKFKSYNESCKRCVCFPICGGGCYANHLVRDNAGCVRIKSALKDILKLYIRRLYNGNNNE